MKLTKKQKDFIQNNLDKLSSKQIAKELNVDLQIIQKYINTIKKDIISSRLQTQNSNLKKYHLACCFIIFVLTFAVYFNSLKNPFVYDDNSTIVGNYYIKDFNNFGYLFTKNYFSYFGEATYRPLCTLSYFIDYYFYKLNPFGYHITNTSFHTLSAIFVYFLIFIATKNFLLSLFTSLLFALHPIQTEAVNAISFREDLMAMAFSLLSIIMFIKMINLSNYKKYLFYALSLFSFTLGIFSKETALITPFVLVLYDFIFVGKSIKEIIRRKYYYLGFFVILLLYFYLTKFILYNPNPVKLDHFGGSIIITLLTMSKVFVYYLKNLILPVELYADYVIPLSYSIFEPLVLFSITIIILIFALGIKIHKNHREIFFGILYFFITLIPVSNIIPIGYLMADRYLYMSSLGFCIVLSYLLIKLLKDKTRLVASFSIILIFYSFLTIKQNKIWSNDIVLTKRTIKKFPNSFSANKYLGSFYIKKGNYDDAIKYLDKAIEIDENRPESYVNRGIVYCNKGLYDRALEDFDKAIQLSPKFVEAYSSRGLLYANKELYNEALEDFNKAIQLSPKFVEAYSSRGLVFFKIGMYSSALKDYNTALRLDPSHMLTYNNRGILYAKKGLNQLAIKDLKKAADLGFDLARKNLKEYFNIDYYAKPQIHLGKIRY